LLVIASKQSATETILAGRDGDRRPESVGYPEPSYAA
jgi:hypothetical protein